MGLFDDMKPYYPEISLFGSFIIERAIGIAPVAAGGTYLALRGYKLYRQLNATDGIEVFTEASEILESETSRLKNLVQ